MAKVKIPRYDQRTVPDTLGVTPRVPGVQIRDHVGAAAQRMVGGMQDAIGTYAAIDAQIKAKQKADEEEDAKVYSANAIAHASLTTMQEFARRQEEAEPGAPNFAQGIQDYVDEAEETAVSQAPNEIAARFMRESFLRLKTDTLQRAYQFEVSERRQWRVDTGKSAIDATAAAMAMDPSRLPVALAEQRAVIDAMQIPPESKRALKQYLDETVSTAAALGRVERDPLGARRALAARLGVDETEIAGAGGAAEVVWSRMIRQESGGRQLAADGRPLTSKAGAVGIAQIMPETGPEAARLAGLAWDPQRLRTDANYNAALGRAYFDHQLAEFRHPAIAAAAYNAGPDAVRGWLDKYGDPRVGEISVESWADKIPYAETREYVAAVAPPTLGVAQAIALAPGGQKTGDPAMDLLPITKVVSLLGQTNSAIEKDKAQYRSYVSSRVADDMAAFGDGRMPPAPLQAGDFVAAYGDVEGVRQWEAYRSGQQYASDIAALGTQTPAQINETLQARLPPTGEGYDVQIRQYGVLKQAAQAVLTQRAADPIAWAAKTGLGDVTPLNFQDPQGFGAELKKRVGVADTMARQYGTPYTLLSKGEASQLGQMAKAMTAAEKGQLLTRIREALPDQGAYQSVMAQLRPGSPVTAIAGSIMVQPRAVTAISAGAASREQVMPAGQIALRLLEGEEVLNPSAGGKALLKMPSDKDLLQIWTDTVGDAYRGSPQTGADSFKAFQAMYAAEAARAGNIAGELDKPTAERAARLVTGGVADVNGAHVVLPWGMAESTFLQAARFEYGKLGRATPFEDVQLLTVGNGVYAVTEGLDSVTGADGKPVFIRVAGEVASRTGRIEGR